MTAILFLVQALTVSSQVDSVVVYPHQVMVVRNVSATVSGPGELVFPSLPGALGDNSVRIKAPGIRVGEVQVRRGYLAEPTPEVKRLLARLQELEDQFKGLNDEGAVLEASYDSTTLARLLHSLPRPSLTPSPPPLVGVFGGVLDHFMGDPATRLEALG